MGIFSYIQGQRLFALCVLVAALWSCVATALPEYELLQVQVLHRHGARSPLVDHNQTAICGTRYPCGFLNEPGQKMLVNVGRFLRERYTKDAEVVDPAAPFLSSDGYNLTVSYSRSTDVLRTLQSSDALLRGMFPDMDAYYPAIHTIDQSTDVLLLSDSIPALQAVIRYGNPERDALCVPVVDKHFPDVTVLREIGREVHMEGFCADEKNRMPCSSALCDIGLAYEATGELAATKKLAANLDKLCAATECEFRFRFAYNASDPVKARQGSLGQPLAQEMLSNMHLLLDSQQKQQQQAEEGVSAGTPTYKFYEYSAHDTTVAPFAATLGDMSYEGMFPPFATTFIVELLAEKGEKAGKEGAGRFVRVLRGSPGVRPETGYTFALTGFDLRCQDTQGVVYVAKKNVCPLADFERFVQSSAPTDPAGLCYIDPVLLERLSCPATAPSSLGGEGDASTGVPSDCAEYRRACPRQACGAAYFLSAVDYHCYPSSSGGNGGGGGGQHGGGVGRSDVALALVFFLCGALVGLCLLLLKRTCEQRRRRQGYELPV